MKIAQVAPLFESVPPKFYGGTERVVSYLTESLVDLGHDVTLFASGDSQTKAKLLAPRHISIRLDKTCKDYMASHILMLEQLNKIKEEFDVIHFHIDYIHFPITRSWSVPFATTLHGRLDLPDLPALYSEFNESPVISISDSQRDPLPMANWAGTVYHGLPKDSYQYKEGSGRYLAFLGRISPEKRVDWAIEIAKTLKMPIRIAAKVDQVDQDYFNEHIEPLLKHELVKYIGEIGEGEKGEFLSNAMALLFPIDWPEPFGLVMIEAMSCGTPVIANRKGSVSEVLQNGLTGFIVDDFNAAVEATKKASTLDRKKVRQTFIDRFTADRMAKDYLEIYKKLIENKKRHG